MPQIKAWHVEQLDFPADCNVIVGQSHFIKTVEDIYEALITSSPCIKFGVAFCEASGERLIRKDGNDPGLVSVAVDNAQKIASGHVFIVVLRDAYPINVLNRIKDIQEICTVFAATANPLQVLIAETDQGRGVAGVVDGGTPLGVESGDGEKWRHSLLRDIIGYKK